MRTPFVVGNWKMNQLVPAALALATEVKHQGGALRGVQLAIAPPTTALWPVARRLDDSNIELAAQNCHTESKGAFTGEVSAAMLADIGCRWVILGHSERRALFGESNEWVGQKVSAALGAGLGAILCVGETLAERDAGRTFAVIEAQLRAGLAHATLGAKLVIAYEPVWAIGTGKTASPAQAQEVHAHLRAQLRAMAPVAAADGTRILYGGSVKPDNASALLGQPDIDGALVGGASLDAGQFLAIAKAAKPS